jgi:hypothetical protein
MQVDQAKLEKLTKEEWEQLRKHGACFFCQKDGHMARACPEKPKKEGSKTSDKPKAQVAEVKTDKEKKKDPPPSYKASVSDLHASIRKMSKDKRDKLLEKLIEEGSDNEGATSKKEDF